MCPTPPVGRALRARRAAAAATVLCACVLLPLHCVGQAVPPPPPPSPPPGYGALHAPGTPPFNDGKIIIGGLGINGQATFLSQFGPIFATYLNSALGPVLNKTFVAVYLDFTTSYTAVAQNQLDFIYVNPSIYVCLEAQYGVSAVTSIQTLRPSPSGASVPQSTFGANFFSLANRSDIQLIADIAGKRLEGADLTGLGAGQAQWNEMVQRNLSFWNLPRAVIFSHNQNSVAGDVYAGLADVGMVRTDLLEGLQKANCTGVTPPCFPLNTFKILEPKAGLPASFPFNSSTQLFPEWPVAAMPHVDFNTQKLVAQALMAMDYRAAPSNASLSKAKVATFTPPLPYIRLREMQSTLGWIVNGSCITSTQTYDTIVCQPGTFKKSVAIVNGSCTSSGLACPAGYDCVCSPCQPVPAVQMAVTLAQADTPANASTCSKLAVCLVAVQTKTVLVTLTDNWFGAARVALGAAPIGTVQFKYHGSSAAGAAAPWVAANASGSGTWTLQLATPITGFLLLEASVDGVPMESSPFVLSVVPPVCPGAGSSPNAAGVCVCPPSYTASGPNGGCQQPHRTIDVGGAAGGSAGGVALLIIVLVVAFALMRRRAERLWCIPLSQIVFADPPEVLGRGTFGLVVAGVYRGTNVALKRTLPAAHHAAAPLGHSSRENSRLAPGYKNSSSGVQQFDLQIIAEEQLGAARMSAGPRMSHAPRASHAPRTSRASTVVDASRRLFARASLTAPDGTPLQSVDVVLNHPLPRAGQSDLRGDLVLGTSKLSLASSSSSSGTHSGTHTGMASGGHFGTSSAGLLGKLQRVRRAAALRADFVQEMRTVVHLRHPNITTVLGAVLQRDADPILVMELMERGSLYDLLHNDTLPLDADIVLPIMSDVVNGMAFLHAASPPVLHNDLKSANILVDASFRAKVADFGLSGKSRVTGGAPGTPFWMAPELLRGVGSNTTATDVYALGITFAEVFSRQDPYDGEDAVTVLKLIARGPLPDQLPKRPAVGATVPPQFVDLMRRCWHEDIAVRPTMAAVAAELKAAGHDGTSTSVTAALLAAKTHHMGETALLHNIFPPAVAAALAEDRKVEPQHFDCVTVFFSDVVGFTGISERLSPIKVMRMLERLYSRFDALTAEHHLFKVETIGDAYMVCGNLVDGQTNDHAARVAAFACDAIAAAAQVAIDEEDPAAGTVVVRAGFHCGPVVASVVGQTNPRYCLFGDVVNTASRCESNSEPGKVTLSQAAADLVRAQAPGATLVSRGLVPIKGKGTMPLFFLHTPPPRDTQTWRTH